MGLSNEPFDEGFFSTVGHWFLVECFLISVFTDVLQPENPFFVVGLKGLIMHK